MDNNTYSNFDIVKAKKHIRDLLKSKGKTHKEIYDSIHMRQSDFSGCLSTTGDKVKRFFTIDQLWSIANLLDCTIDDLIGRKPISTEYFCDPEDISLADICDALVVFDRIVHPKYLKNNKGTVYMTSKYSEIRELFEKYDEMKKILDADDLAYWINGYKAKNKDRTRKNEFLTEYEQGKKIILGMVKNKTLFALADEALKNRNRYDGMENFKHDLKNVYEALSEDLRLRVYNAIPQYIKESGLVEGSTQTLILTYYRIIYNELHTNK